MTWRRFLALLFLIALVILLRYCGPAPLGPDLRADCDYLESPIAGDRGDTAEYVREGMFFVAGGQAQPAIDQLQNQGIDGVGAIGLEDADEVANLINDYHCAPYDRALSGDDVADVVATDTWTAAADAVDVIVLPDGVAVDRALTALDGQFGAVPIQIFGTENHFGGFPGVDPTEVNEPINAAPIGVATIDGPIIGVIDTGFHDNAGVIKGGGLPTRQRDGEVGGQTVYRGEDQSWVRDVAGLLWNTKQLENIDSYNPGEGVCRPSHGEFVASVIKQVQPGATIYGANAFFRRHTAKGDVVRCWETDEIAVVFALARLEVIAEQGNVQFDVITMSLGTVSHDRDGQPMAPVALEAALSADLSWAGQVVAAAGNTEPISPVYPAAFENVVGVGPRAESGEVVYWDADGNPVVQEPPSWMAVNAPGCHLVGLATEDPFERWMWSGSSFAAPLYAASVAAGDEVPDYDDLDDAMRGVGQVDEDLLHCPVERGSVG